MTDRNIQLSRRKVLAGLGTVGLASAGAGLGTTAWLSDQESFANNRLVAGELDLLVDWQQHYYGPSVPVEGDPTEYGYGSAGAPYVNAHPDHDNDGEQSLVVNDTLHRYSDEDANIAGALSCDTLDQDYENSFDGGQGQDRLVELTDVKPGDEGEITFSLHLCDNPGYLWMQADNVTESENGVYEPEIGAGDETDTPGSADQSGELADLIDVELWYDNDCDNTVSPGVEGDIMLTLDLSGSMLYDQYGGVVSTASIDVPQSDGSTTTHDETTKIDLVEIAAKQFLTYLDDLNADVQIGIAYFDGSTDETARIGLLRELTPNLTGSGGVTESLDDLRQTLANIVTDDPSPTVDDGNPDPSAGGNIATGTYIGEGVNVGQDELASPRARNGVEYINIVLSDGQSFEGGDGNDYDDPQTAADNARSASPSPATDLYTISIDEGDDATLSDMAGPAGSSGGDPNYFFNVDDPADISMVFGSVADLFAPEEVFFSGTLAEAFDALTDGDGIPLDAAGFTQFDELTGAPSSDDRDCFHPALTYCLGFRWSLPTTVGNEIQSDSVGFDIGFYAEQCRHNDGSGPALS